MSASNAMWRVPVVIRPLDRAFTLSRILLVPALVFVGSITAIKGVASIGSSYGLVVATALAVLYIFTLQLSPVEQRVDRVFAVARRRVAISCDHNYSNQHRDGLACHLTAEALRAPVFRYEAQQTAVAALLRLAMPATAGTGSSKAVAEAVRPGLHCYSCKPCCAT